MAAKRLVLSIFLLTLVLAFPALGHGEKVKLVFASGYDTNRFYDQMIPIFEKRHPNIEIDVWAEDNSSNYNEKLQVMAAGGQQLDVVSLIPSLQPALIDAGIYRPLDDLIARDKSTYDFADFDPVSLQSNQWNGKQYGLPFRANMVWVLHQKEAFAQAGLASPESMVKEGRWTVDTLLESAKKLTRIRDDGTPESIGYSNISTSPRMWAPMYWAYGGSFYTPDGKRARVAEPSSIHALERIQELIQQQVLFPLAMDDYRAQLGMSAMWQTWFGTVGFAEDIWGVGNTDMVPSPVGPQSTVTNTYEVSGYGISPTSKHPDEAWSFIKFLASPEAEEILLRAPKGGGVPTRRSNRKVLEDMFDAPRNIQGWQFIEDGLRRAKAIVPYDPQYATIVRGNLFGPILTENAPVVESAENTTRMIDTK